MCQFEENSGFLVFGNFNERDGTEVLRDFSFCSICYMAIGCRIVPPINFPSPTEDPLSKRQSAIE